MKLLVSDDAGLAGPILGVATQSEMKSVNEYTVPGLTL
jgi:hypothetical protein